MNTDAHRIQGHTFHAQADQFRYPEASRNGEVEHGAIANPVPCCGIGRVEQRLHFVLHKIRNQAGVGPLKWDGQDATNLFECSWLAML